MDNHEDYSADRFASIFVRVLVWVAVVFVVGFLLFPILVDERHPGLRASCQSGMNQIGKAIKAYLSDWDECYPSNRQFLPGGGLGPVSNRVKLSKVGIEPESGKPYRNEYGLSWVEGLYPYVEPIGEQDDEYNTWKCALSHEKFDTPTSRSAAVSYVMNRNLIEKYETVIRDPSKLMLLREMDRLVDSELRPINDSLDEGEPPVSAFLTGNDAKLGRTNNMLHDSGSNVLFVDGHITTFRKAAFSGKCKWYSKTKTWGSADGSIMVSP